MIRDHLQAFVVEAIAQAQAANDLPPFDIPSITLEHPRQSEMGDYATSIALQLARIAKLAPPQIAQRIAKHLHANDIFTVEVAGGFINLRLTPQFLSAQISNILGSGENWGNTDLGKGQRAQVEFGSANPTGFMTIGTGRNVITGDTLANTLAAAGYSTHREWYVNNAGTQVRVFGSTVFARYAQALGLDEPMPEKGYLGEDVIAVAEAIKAKAGDAFLHVPKEEAIRTLGKLGIDEVMANIKTTLARINIRYDNFFSERSLYESGLANEMLELLSQKGLIIEHDGAQWFSEDGSPIRKGQAQKKTSAEYAEASNDDDADEAEPEEKGKRLPVQAVVMRSAKIIANPEERSTYFTSDIPYAYNKVIQRGFNPAVYVWGEDHQGDVERVKVAAQAVGVPADAIKILIYRFITLLRDGVEARMGKRKGNAILVDDVLDEIGVDALRYIMLCRSMDTKFSFDIGVLKEENEKNPVFYVQYGHARICSILRKASEEGWLPEGWQEVQSSFSHPSELELIRRILQLPEVVELVATSLHPHHYTTYAREVTQAFSKFYEDCRIKGTEHAVASSRLQLAQATQRTLAKVLALMGMSAPERM